MNRPDPPKLRRVISLPLLTLYGVGTTVGAGIYVLIGKVAERAGLFAPLSILVAAVLAGLTAFAFAELSARFPRSAGEAVYVREGFNSRNLALAIGLLVILAGVISAATIVNGAVGYALQLISGPRDLLVIVVVLLLFLIAAWGIGESMTAAAAITLLEICGLLLVVWAGLTLEAPATDLKPTDFIPPADPVIWSGIMAGGFLAFYAFIGFEDMVNVAEEVKDVTRTMPAAILLTLAFTTLAYVLIAWIAVIVLPIGELSQSDAPLALIYSRSTGQSATLITVIGVFATLNGALVQIIMGARVLYGLGNQGWIPSIFARTERFTRTPVFATLVVAAVVLLLALGFALEDLAGATTFVTLTIFTLVNLALIRVKRRDPAPDGIRVYPLWLPVAGAAVSAGFLLLESWRLIGL